MKILRITPGLTHCHNYREILGLDKLSYSEQYKIMQDQEVFIPGSWVKSMEKLGVEALDTIYYDLNFYKAWLRQHKDLISQSKFVKLMNSFDHAEIIAAQISIYKPDYVYLYAGGMLCVDITIRNKITKLTNHSFEYLGFWADELPSMYSYKDFFDNINQIFVSTQSYKKMLSNNGLESTVIGNCFTLTSSNKISRKPIKDRPIDLLFIGTTGYAVPEHIPRYEFLYKLCNDKKVNIKIISNEPSRLANKNSLSYLIKSQVIIMLSCMPIKVIELLVSNKIILRKLKTAAKIALAVKINGVSISSYYHSSEHPKANYFKSKLPLHVKFPNKVTKDNIFGLNYYEYLNNAKVVLNIHRSELHDYGNIRCFEATGMGSLLMTNRVKSMSEYFENNSEYLGFESYEEFLDRYKSIINNPKNLNKISEAGTKKTLLNFTSDNQAKKMLDSIHEKNITNRPHQ